MQISPELQHIRDLIDSSTARSSGIPSPIDPTPGIDEEVVAEIFAGNPAPICQVMKNFAATGPPSPSCPPPGQSQEHIQQMGCNVLKSNTPGGALNSLYNSNDVQSAMGSAPVARNILDPLVSKLGDNMDKDSQCVSDWRKIRKVGNTCCPKPAGLSTAAMIGIGVGSVVGLIFIVLLIVHLTSGKRRGALQFGKLF